MTAGSLLPDPPARAGHVFAAKVSRVDPFSVTLDNYGTTYESAATWVAAGQVPARGQPVLAVMDDKPTPGVWAFPAAPMPAIALDALAAAVVERMWMTGDVRHTLRSTAAAGWLFPTGQQITSTWPELRALLVAQGSPHGTSGGNPLLPDFRGRALIGAGTGAGLTARTLGDLVGAETHVLTTAQMPAHVHGPGAGTIFPLGGAAGWATFGGSGVNLTQAATTGSTGGDGSHPNMQPSAAVSIEVKT